MLMEVGSQDEEAAASAAISAAIASRDLELDALQAARARLDRLAACFPAQPGQYPAHTRLADAARMRRAGAAGLTVPEGETPPRPHRPVQTVPQRPCPEAGIS